MNLWLSIASSFLLLPLVLVIAVRLWPKQVARFNRMVTNRTIGRLANVLKIPTFGYVIHVGRKSGKVHRTPVNVFRIRDGFLFGLTYGRDTEWVKNVLAAGRCAEETRGRVYELVDPAFVNKPLPRGGLPFIFWVVLRLMQVEGLKFKNAPRAMPKAV